MSSTKLEKIIGEIIVQNLTMDISEDQIINAVYEDEPFIVTYTSSCPSSFLICC